MNRDTIDRVDQILSTLIYALLFLIGFAMFTLIFSGVIGIVLLYSLGILSGIMGFKFPISHVITSFRRLSVQGGRLRLL